VVKVSRRRSDPDESLTTQPGYALVGVLRIPEAQLSPVRAIWKRVAVALLALLVAVITVYLGRDGYTDVRGVPLSVTDCVYFATISLTTVGYGDLTPYTEVARLTNIVILTPLRILFLVVLVGTTLQVLTERSRQAWKIQRWRSRVRNHTVVVGYGTKGKSAVATIRDVEQTELGGSPRHLPDIVLGVVRDGHLLRVDAPEVDAIETGDRLLYVRNTGK
jgi:voltage-gated potassium channel